MSTNANKKIFTPKNKSNEKYLEAGDTLNIVLWFTVIFVLIWFVLFLTKPSFVMTKNKYEINGTTILLWSLGISIVLTIAVYFFAIRK